MSLCKKKPHENVIDNSILIVSQPASSPPCCLCCVAKWFFLLVVGRDGCLLSEAEDGPLWLLSRSSAATQSMQSAQQCQHLIVGNADSKALSWTCILTRPSSDLWEQRSVSSIDTMDIYYRVFPDQNGTPFPHQKKGVGLEGTLDNITPAPCHIWLDWS